MTTLLSQSEVALFRSLKRTATVLLLICKLDKPVGSSDIADILDIDDDTAAKYLKSLARLGLITRTAYRNGYILTSGGRQLVFNQPNQVHDGSHRAQDLSEGQALEDLDTNPQALKVLSQGQALKDQFDQGVALPNIAKDNTNQNNQIAKPENFGFQPEFSLPKPEKFGFQEEKIEEEVKDLKLIKSSSSKETKTEKTGFREQMAFLLERSCLLFDGKVVFLKGLPDTDPQIVLGWLAHVYDQRRDLNEPPNTAYCGIRDHCSPQAKYLENPAKYLPAEYLQAVGLEHLIEEKSPEEEQEWTTTWVDEEDITEEIDQSIVQVVGARTPVDAWEIAVHELQQEMPRATFNNYIRDTKIIRYEQPDLIVIGATSAYNRDWLDSRLTSTITRLLTGIFNRSVKVKFEEG